MRFSSLKPAVSSEVKVAISKGLLKSPSMTLFTASLDYIHEYKPFVYIIILYNLYINIYTIIIVK